MLETIFVLIIGATIYTFWKCIGTPKKNNEKRTKVMEQKIEAMGGKIIKIEPIKRNISPFCDEVNQEDGSIHVFYKIQYSKEDEIKDGWAILKLRQSIVGPAGATIDEWFWKF